MPKPKQRKSRSVSSKRPSKQRKAALKEVPDSPAEPSVTASDQKMSGLDAAVRVLQEAGEPLNCAQMVERMTAQGYWSTSGKTPAATIYSAILREMRTKGESCRFNKVERGKFVFKA